MRAAGAAPEIGSSPRRFAAFLSYRHAEPDATWARWLHTALETYRVPGALVAQGAPPRLGRVYRDQEELGASTHLSVDLRRALETSDSLIVVCSPRAFGSHWIDLEVRHFREHGAGPGRLFALWIEGEREQALPPALCELRQPRWGGLEPVPIDVRPKSGVRVGDQRRTACIAFAAAILGRPYDELRRRDDERRRRARWAWGVACAATLAVTVSLAAWGVSSRRAADDASASESEARGDVDALARTLMASLDDRLRPVGRLDALEPAAAAVLAYDATIPARRRNHGTQRTRVAALLVQGDARLERGDVGAAEQSYAAALAALEDPASRDGPADERQTSLALCHERLGNVCRARGELAQARERYERSGTILSTLLAARPGDARLARHQEVNANKQGDLWRTQGDAAAARVAYARALAIARRLAEGSPDDAVLQADLATCHDKLGALCFEEGALAEAAIAFGEALAIARRLSAADPRHAERMRDVSIGLDRVANVRAATGDEPGALEAYVESLSITRRLAAQDPLNLEWQRDLSVSLLKVGDVHLERDDLPLAHKAYADALAISTRLASEQPAVVTWQRDLSVTHDKLGEVARRRKDHYAAQESFEAALAVRMRLFDRTPDDVELQELLFNSHYNLAAIRAAAGDLPGALAFFRKAAGYPLPGVPRSTLQKKKDADLAALVRRLEALLPTRGSGG